MESIKNIIKGRRSCRDFCDETISRERIESLINDAVWVPNGSNNQPWRFVVITDKSLLKKYSDYAKSDWLSRLKQAPQMQQYEKMITDPEYNIFYNAPVLIIVYGNSESFWYVYDCSMVAYNLHLLAEESGLGACWIGFAHNVFSSKETKAELGIPVGHELVAPVIIGRPARSGATTEVSRKPFVTNYFDGGR